MAQEDLVLVGLGPAKEPGLLYPTPVLESPPGRHFRILGGSGAPTHQGTMVAPGWPASLLQSECWGSLHPLPGTGTGFSYFGENNTEFHPPEVGSGGQFLGWGTTGFMGF